MATASSKGLVKSLSCRAQGTASVTMATTFAILFVRFQISSVGPVSPVNVIACPFISRITPYAGI